MSGLDATIVIIALPSILQDLHASIVHGIWIITGYALMITILLVMLGRIADIYGRIRLYNLGFAIFTIGSALCAISATGEELIIFRFIQGAGAAMLMVNGAAILTDSFPNRQLGMAMGINMAAMNVGSLAGFSLSGVMVTYFGWRSIFILNIPVGIFGTLWGYLRLRDNSERKPGQKFDYVGMVLYCVGLLTVLLALTIGNPTSTRNLVILGAGIAVFIVLVFFELRKQYPILDLTLFKIRLFAAGNMTGFLNSLAFSCGPFLRSLYLQLVLGYSVLKAGLVLIPMEVIVLLFGPISGRISDKYGSRALASVGLILNAAALFWFSTLNENSSYASVLVSLILFGLGRALFVSPNTSSIMGSVPPEKRGVANGIRMTLIQTGNVISVPFSLLLMTLVMPYDQLSQIVGNTLVSSSQVPVFLKAINQACLILGIITLLAVIPSLLRGSRKTPIPADFHTGR
jgi:EmrB/QacA subfamily drug resistance transporter